MPVRDAKDRKKRPVGTGVLAYFPDALQEVAFVSYIGNEQHNPGQPLHWDRSKSKDDFDAAARHMTDSTIEDLDVDTAYHLAKAAWRILATLQKKIEENRAKAETINLSASGIMSNMKRTASGLEPGGSCTHIACS